MARTALLLAAALVAMLSLALAAEPVKRPRLLGGPEEADVREEGVRRALDFALSEYNKASNDRFHSRARQVLRARKQVRVSWPARLGLPGCGPAGWKSGKRDRHKSAPRQGPSLSPPPPFPLSQIIPAAAWPER